MDIEEVTRRLDAQAKAIRDLRTRVSLLEGTQSGDQADPTTAAAGVYVPKDTCAICRGSKGAGRDALTCRTCGPEYQAAIKSADRPAYRVCSNCGGSKKPDTRLLCTPCSRSFRLWKATR